MKFITPQNINQTSQKLLNIFQCYQTFEGEPQGLTDQLPSPIASVKSDVLFFTRATIPAFCSGATRQHRTTEHLLAS